MKNSKICIPSLLGAGLLACTISACQCEKAQVPVANHADLILMNQTGYATNSQKLALIKTTTAVNVSVVDTTGKQVLSVETAQGKHWNLSGDDVAVADFSALNREGVYFLKVNDTIVSHPVTITAQPYGEVAKAAIKALYYNRTAVAIDSVHGGAWARAAGHPDTVVYVHESAASAKRPAGTIISSPGGWYDAGDYNKYVVNSGISTYTMLKVIEDYPDHFKSQNLNIPESNNALPDVLDETLFNLRWVMTMQDPNDGGVYHKLTEKSFTAFIMPDACHDARYVVQKGTAAALNYAALLAKAVRVTDAYKQQLPGLADSCLSRALLAWQWAVKHPDVLYLQPKDIFTGAYDDTRMDDEFYWAACELYLTTGDAQFIPYIVKNYKSWGVPTWGTPGTMGTLSLLKATTTLPDEITKLNFKADYLAMVDSMLTTDQSAPYRVSIGKFDWGSNSDVVNQGMLKMVAHQMTGDNRYLLSAINDADYIMGRNATGYCFVTGFGAKKVMNIHHRPSAADGVNDPVPGFLAGGPNTVVLTDCGDAVVRDTFPAKSFADETCSYSTNEIAINWNAPLAYLFNALAASVK